MRSARIFAPAMKVMAAEFEAAKPASFSHDGSCDGSCRASIVFQQMLRARTLQLRAAIRRRGRTDEPVAPEELPELSEELLEQTRAAVLARISEFGQGPLLIRRSRE